MSLSERLLDIPVEHLENICGQFDAYIKKIEKELNVTIITRDDKVKIIGKENALDTASQVFCELTSISKKGTPITCQQVDYLLTLASRNQQEEFSKLDADTICHTIYGKPVKPKTLGQKYYVDAIREKMITFGVGPAGTGKTYLAIAMAVTAFKNEEVSKIILTRPAIEAGEKLGFLPGDMQSKVDPYLRPLYDALYQIMGAENFARNMEKGAIEVAPLAYMRGRTLDNSFIILDEAQNTTPAQMKMFLTRIGFGSHAVITGDMTQKDLAPGVQSGLDQALRILSKVEGIAICRLKSEDVVRHPLVQRIVDAYESFEKRKEKTTHVAGKRQ